MDEYEQVIVTLFRHCGFTHDPGTERSCPEVAPIPYEEFQQGVVPGYWVRSVALHLGDTRRACSDTHEYLRLLPAFLRGGSEAMPEDWLEEYLPVVVSDELRFHVFCFLTLSETIRDKIEDAFSGLAQCLIPGPSSDHRSRVPVAALSRYLLADGSLAADEALWAARQIARLDTHCIRTRDAVDGLVSRTEAPVEELVQAFADVQGAMLDIARALVEAEYAVGIWGRYAP